MSTVEYINEDDRNKLFHQEMEIEVEEEGAQEEIEKIRRRRPISPNLALYFKEEYGLQVLLDTDFNLYEAVQEYGEDFLTIESEEYKKRGEKDGSKKRLALITKLLYGLTLQDEIASRYNYRELGKDFFDSWRDEIFKVLRETKEHNRPEISLELDRALDRFLLEHFVRSRETKKACQSYILLAYNAENLIRQVRTAPGEYKKSIEEILPPKTLKQMQIPPADSASSYIIKRLFLLSSEHSFSSYQEEFLKARKEALWAALKAHRRNCRKALGLKGAAEIVLQKREPRE